MSTNSSEKFSIADYVIFSLSIFISALVGFYYAFTGGKQKTVGEYLFGDRNLKVFPVAMSIVASGTSAIGILAVTAEIYNYGSQVVVESLSIFIFAPITAIIYLPLFYKLKLSSTYEYLELRFNKSVRRIATFIFLFQTQIYMSTCLYAPASALSQVTGLSLWATVVGTSIVCILYTVIGGIKAVVLTDTIQQALVIIGLLAVVIKGFIVVGGIESIYTIAKNGGRTQFLDWNPDPTVMYTVWSTFFGGIFGWLPFYAVDQCLVQRYLSLSSIKKAQKAILLTAIIYLSLKVLYLLTGWILYARFADCNPMEIGKIERSDQILPLFVMDSLSDTTGLPGLFVAAIYSASLSAISSGLTAMATVILEDIIKPVSKYLFGSKFNERKEAFISKGIVLLFGGITLGLAFLIPLLGKTLFQITMSLYGITSGPFLAIFTLGMFFTQVHSWAAGSSIILSIIFTAWIATGSYIYPNMKLPNLTFPNDGCNVSNFTDDLFSSTKATTLTELGNENFTSTLPAITKLYGLSYFHYPMVGFFVALFFGFFLSPFFNLWRPEKVLPKYVYTPTQIFRNIFPKKSPKRSVNGAPFSSYKESDAIFDLAEKGPLRNDPEL